MLQYSISHVFSSLLNNQLHAFGSLFSTVFLSFLYTRQVVGRFVHLGYIKINWLMLFREINAVYFQNNMKHYIHPVGNMHRFLILEQVVYIQSSLCFKEVDAIFSKQCVYAFVKTEQFWEFCKAALITLYFILKQDELYMNA